MKIPLATLLAFLCALFATKAQPPYVERVINFCPQQVSLEPIGFSLQDGEFYIDAVQNSVFIYETGPYSMTVSQSNCYLYNIDTLGNQQWGYGILNSACHEYSRRSSNVITTATNLYVSGTVQSSNDINEHFHGPLGDCLSHPSSSPSDMFLTKTTTEGSLKWTKCFGGYDYDEGCDILLSSTGNSIILAGTVVVASNGDYVNPLGGQDFWAVEIDTSTGNIIREKSLGTTSNDFLSDIINTHDNGYLLSGTTYRHGSSNSLDLILIKTDSLLNEQWQLILPTPARDLGSVLLEDSLSGSIYWMVSTAETDSIFHTNIQSYQIDGDDEWNMNNWVVKLDKTGNIIWKKCIGTPYKESIINGNANIIFNDNNEIVITTFSDTDSTQYNGKIDIRFLKLDTLGNLLTEKKLPDFYTIADIISLGNERYVCLPISKMIYIAVFK